MSQTLICLQNVIFGNDDIKIDITENNNGILTILIDNEFTLDILSNMAENEKQETFRLILKISGELSNIGYVSNESPEKRVQLH